MHSKTLPCYLGALTLLGIAFSATAEDAFELPPINYSATQATDRVARLQRALEKGEVDLDPKLPDKEFVGRLLEVLEVPAASQVLVFSKSSLQNSHINPRHPRALYFSDDLYFGWAHGSDKFEIISSDPRLGVVFYLLERDRSAEKIEVFRESGECFSCHAAGRTGGRPGMVIRSLYVEETGQPIFSAGSFQVDHTTPFEDRWGGWYVTGYHGDARHLGNIFSEALSDGRASFDRDPGANLETLDQFFDPTDYLVPTSDIVALMVMEHQAAMHNRLIEGHYTVRSAIHRSRQLNRELGLDDPDGLSESCRRIIRNQAEKIIEDLLFTDEAPLPEGGIESEGPFMAAFAESARPNERGRSLRDFQLLDRIFKYRCSYMIYSEAFENLPAELHHEVLTRLDAVLQSQDGSDLGSHLSASERERIRDILVETLPGFPIQPADPEALTASAEG